jgi:hypothetical protein
MVRVLCLLFAMVSSDMCSALEIRRVAACSGVVLRLRGDFRDGDYARFRSHFRKKTAVIGLDLSSDGGVLEEAVRIANFAQCLCCRGMQLRLRICLLRCVQALSCPKFENRRPFCI